MEPGSYRILKPPTSDELIKLLYENMNKGETTIEVETNDNKSTVLIIKPNVIHHSAGEMFLLGCRVADGTWVDIRGVLGETAILFVE